MATGALLRISGSNDKRMDSYKWRSLSQPNTIRLLTLEGGLREHELWGDLTSTTIESAPAYEAVSYAWESNETPKNLTTPEGLILIPDCAWKALLDLRFTHQRRVLWIDSVCIDQCNKKEKAQQVSIMEKIFASAQTVLAYMGPETPYTVLGLWLLDQILRVLGTNGNVKAVLSNERDLFGLGLPSINDISWTSLLSIADSPWFKRIWTTQEFVVSRAAQFIIGRITLEPDFLLGALSVAGTGLLQMASSSNTDSNAFKRSMGLSNYILPLSSLRETYQNGKRAMLRELLRLHRHKLATEVRDKLFVLRNLARDGDHPSLTPDYDSPLVDIFI